MLKSSAINLRLAKIQSKTYDLQAHMFETLDEVDKLLNEICEIVSDKN